MEPNIGDHQKWYKTTPGMIFVGVLGLLFIGGLWFGGLIVYYSLGISRGDGATLEADLRASQFTFDTSRHTEESTPIVLEDVQSIIHGETPTLGSPDAPVTIVAFIDFECPFCQAAFPTFQRVIEHYEPVVYVVFKHFPLASVHPLSVKASEASACAHEQGAFWPYYQMVFERKALAQTSLRSYAQSLGLNMVQFNGCLEECRYKHVLDTDLRDGVSLGTRGTPTYFINGQRVEGAVSREEWDARILEHLSSEL